MSDLSLRLSVVDDLGHINIRGNARNREFRDSVKAASGTPLPGEPNTLSDGENRIVWLGPDEWLIVAPADGTAKLVAGLERKLRGQHCAVNDLSGGQRMLRLSGPGARQVLAKGCTLDLHPDVFATGDCAQTGLGKANVIIACRGSDDTFEIIVRRSFSDYVLQWLRRAGADHGIEFA